MPTLLVVHHTPSPSLDAMLDAVLHGTRAEGIDDVDVVTKAALEATAIDALAADGYIIGTPANLGYISGALKHFFDLAYYPCLNSSKHRPFGAYIHGDDDTAGAAAAIAKITTGLQWRKVTDDVSLTGTPSLTDLEACWNLGATVAASLVADEPQRRCG